MYIVQTLSYYSDQEHVCSSTPNKVFRHYFIITFSESFAHLESVLQTSSIIKSMTKDCTQLPLGILHLDLKLHEICFKLLQRSIVCYSYVNLLCLCCVLQEMLPTYHIANIKAVIRLL